MKKSSSSSRSSWRGRMRRRRGLNLGGGSSAFRSAQQNALTGAPANQTAAQMPPTRPSQRGPGDPGPAGHPPAQLTIASRRTFDSKLAAVRALVQLQQGFISGTMRRQAPRIPTTDPQRVISFMVTGADAVR